MGSILNKREIERERERERERDEIISLYHVIHI